MRYTLLWLTASSALECVGNGRTRTIISMILWLTASPAFECVEKRFDGFTRIPLDYRRIRPESANVSGSCYGLHWSCVTYRVCYGECDRLQSVQDGFRWAWEFSQCWPVPRKRSWRQGNLLIDWLTSLLGLSSPCFFEVIEEVFGVVVALVGYQFESIDDIWNRNKGKRNKFSYLTIEGLVLLVLLL